MTSNNDVPENVGDAEVIQLLGYLEKFEMLLAILLDYVVDYIADKVDPLNEDDATPEDGVIN